ncbi:serine-rich coiled-coil domain-containing protein 1 isoform X3 [Lepisosteus oculatus]|uniref:serine-rich coiled-coil domain-containing protein 1 isoform X3 n=1 Tax=Lepisosteus oculatus TaxID=7918 RepID=UPI0037226565
MFQPVLSSTRFSSMTSHEERDLPSKGRAPALSEYSRLGCQQSPCRLPVRPALLQSQLYALMGDSGPRRSTLVSRLPIFRRSASKRQGSLPSSPSSSGNANGVHTSSPSSTNSSSSSTGKRRSIFRTPSISFHSKKSGEPRLETTELGFPNGGQAPELAFPKPEESIRPKSRHSFGFVGTRSKKITRSQTEDFEKASTNRNVFINCISSGTNEGDDSGFLDDYSSRRSSKHKKQLLPKSFSSHYRLSKQGLPAYVSDPPRGNAQPPKAETPGSCPGELAESSLQSPMLSDDRTTALTPSEFVPITEDSVSEVEALPSASPAVPREGDFSHVLTASQVFSNPVLPEEEPVQCGSETAGAESGADVPNSEPAEERREEGAEGTQNGPVDELAPVREIADADCTEPEQMPSEQTETKLSNTVIIQEPSKVSCVKPEVKSCHPRRTHTVTVGCSISPYHEIKRMERRLRSASEGTAGGTRLHLNLKEAHYGEISTLQKQRANSSSSKLDSLDVLNNLGSCELDEDDLMLDLDFSDDQRHRFVSREDSSQSIASCLALMHSPMEASADKIPGRDVKAMESSLGSGSVRSPKEARAADSRAPASCALGGLAADSCRPREDELVGLEALPFRLMLQDCTSVKTLLLRLKRTLQESAEMSPASSTHSLPISPISEKSLPFKDAWKDDSPSLLLQLKEKDELISRLRNELEKAQSLQKHLSQRTDKSTQTEIISHDGTAYGSAPVPSRRQLCYMSKQSYEPNPQHKGQKVSAYSHRGPI